MFVCTQNQHASLGHFLVIPDKQLDASPLCHQIMLETFGHLALCTLHSMVPMDGNIDHAQLVARYVKCYI